MVKRQRTYTRTRGPVTVLHVVTTASHFPHLGEVDV